jgi:extracellular solute-binding protein (family 7)
MTADAATDAPGPCATVNLVQFEAEVEKHSGGEIAVEIFDNSRLYRDDQPLDAVASGAIEMGSVATSQIVKKMSALDLFSQPFLLNSEALVRAATGPDGEVRKVFDKAVLEGIRLHAASFVDVVVEAGLKPYDVILLITIIEGAGGQITTWEGKPARSRAVGSSPPATPGCTPRPSPCSPAAAETATCIQTVATTTLPQAACVCRIADPSQFAIVGRRDRGGCQ